MNITESKNEGLQRTYAISITAAEMDEKIAARLQEIAGEVKMPGFRAGKVPLSVVKARFGEQTKGEVIRGMLDEAARKAVEDNKLDLASQPRMDIVKYEDGTDLEATLECEVLPEITVPDLGALKVEKPVLPSNDSEIDETMDRLAQENRPTVKVEKDRAAALGDIVVIDFVGKVDGEAFEGGTAEGHHLELGSGQFIPGFEDGLVGVKSGEKRDVPVQFPAEYQASHLAGKDAVFEVTVQELREKGEAELNDDLASKMGFENLDALRDAVAAQLGSQHEPALRQAVKTSILDQLAETTDFDVPPSLYDSEYQGVARQMNPNPPAEHNHDHDHDHNHDHDHHHPAADEGMDDDAKAEASSVAMRRVRLGLLLTEIGRVNDIQVTEEDTRRAIFEQARRFPGQEQQVLEYYQKNQQAQQQLAGPIFEDKVIDYILELAQVTEVETTTDALYAEEATEGDAKPAAKKAAKKSAKKAAAKKAAAKKPAAKKAASKKAAAKK